MPRLAFIGEILAVALLVISVVVLSRSPLVHEDENEGENEGARPAARSDRRILGVTGCRSPFPCRRRPYRIVTPGRPRGLHVRTECSGRY